MSEKTKTGSKGFLLEEVLRAYFLRAGFFVVRGAPCLVEGEEVTDIDLWLYERSSATARRCQIVDIKYKNKPKAMERVVWTKGLMETLNINGAYVATTDSRGILRKIATRLDITLLDGTDLKRIQGSDKVLYDTRITEERLQTALRNVDRQRQNKKLQNALYDLKAAPIQGMGAHALVRCIGAFNFFSRMTVEAHPGSDAALICGRLACLSAAYVAINLDYIGADASFRTQEERKDIFINAIRYGNINQKEGWRDIQVASNLIRQYVDNGQAVAVTFERRIAQEYAKIPSEIIAEYALKNGKGDALFHVARMLEEYAYDINCSEFDVLDTSLKSFLGVLLDFCGVNRQSFAQARPPQIATPSEKPKADEVENSARKSETQTPPQEAGQNEQPTDLFSR